VQNLGAEPEASSQDDHYTRSCEWLQDYLKANPIVQTLFPKLCQKELGND